MVEYDVMEKAIMCQVAAKLLDALPEEDKKKILEASLEKTLHEMFRPWVVEKAIEIHVTRYMNEYVLESDVQEKIKKKTRDEFDKLMDEVINSIVISSQNGIKSEYRKFVDQKK